MTKKQQIHARAVEDLSLLIEALKSQNIISKETHYLLDSRIKNIKDNTPILYDILTEVAEKGTKRHIYNGVSTVGKEVIQYTYAGHTIQISKD